MRYRPLSGKIVARLRCGMGLTAIPLLALWTPVSVAAMYQCVAKDGTKMFSDTPCATNSAEAPTGIPSALPQRSQEISRLWESLHLGTTGAADYDVMIPLLVRGVAPLDANWGPSHIHWAAVTALVEHDFHQDFEPLVARVQRTQAALWQRALDQSLTEADLRELTGFYGSPLGKDYAQFQLRLAKIFSAASAQVIKAMTTGRATANPDSRTPTAEQTARRQRILDLLLPLWLVRTEPNAIGGRKLLDGAILTTGGNAFDALSLQYAHELGEFERFNRSLAVSHVAAANTLATRAWQVDAVAQELKVAFAAEPQRRAAQWRQAYAVPPDTSPQLPQPIVKRPEELQPGDALFPAENPHPVHQLDITGELPVSIPMGDFQAIYTTDANTQEKASGPCQRYIDFGPNDPYPLTLPLRVLQSVPIVRTGDRYRAAVVVDWPMPGRCNWHLKEIQYRLFVKGYGYELAHHNNGVGQIQVMDTQHRAPLAARGVSFYEGPLDIWCGKLFNRNIAPYYPALCDSLETFRLRVSVDALAAVPAAQKTWHAPVYVSPERTSVQVNFHDVDALAATNPARP